MKRIFILIRVILILILFFVLVSGRRKKPEDKTKCPQVKAIRNFDLDKMMGQWFVIEYYASSEEALAYRCMHAEFTNSAIEEVNMNFTYSFTDDPINEQLLGNITWIIPNPGQPAHWTHSEDTCMLVVYYAPRTENDYFTRDDIRNIDYLAESDFLHQIVSCHFVKSYLTPCCLIYYYTLNILNMSPSDKNRTYHPIFEKVLDFKKNYFLDEGVYNTFVLDSDYESWALLLHCAEKSKVPRYLSSFIMSREPKLGVNVISYLKEKLPKYDIDLSYLFSMSQENCNETSGIDIPPSVYLNRPSVTDRRHPMKHHHDT